MRGPRPARRGRDRRPVAHGGGGLARVDTLDLNPAFCPDAPICLPVVGDEVVWRDDHHVTARYAESRREQVWRILQDSGALD